MKIVVGTGHPAATCQGAAFEYIVNVHKDLVKKGLRDKADILWLSNKPALGDFGVNGVQIKRNGHVMKSDEFIHSVFNDHGICYQIRTGVTQVEAGKIHWQNYEGEEGTTDFDFAMLIPQFKGQPFKYIGKDGEDVSAKLVNLPALCSRMENTVFPTRRWRKHPRPGPPTITIPPTRTFFRLASPLPLPDRFRSHSRTRTTWRSLLLRRGPAWSAA